MPIVEAVVKLHRVNGIPADDAINSWHFLTNSSDPLVYGPLIRDGLVEFYDDDVPTPAPPLDKVSMMFSGELSLDWTLIIRDADPTPPRPVLFQDTGTFTGPSDLGLPAEVAIANSYAGTLVDPLFPGRYRGRIFIGPVNTNTIISDAAGIRRVNDQAQDVLAQASVRLQAYEFVADGFEWGVYSRTGSFFNKTQSGWIDNSFDTIRSRGPRTTARRSWPA